MTRARRPVFILIHALGHGGVTNAVLDQSSMFVEAGHPTTILTLSPEGDRARVAQLRDAGRLSQQVKVRNIHWEYQDLWRDSSDAQPDPTGIGTLRALPGLRVASGTDDVSRFERWFDADGGYLARVRLREDGTRSQAVRYRDRTVWAREHFDALGRVRRAEELTADGHIVREGYFAPNGVAYAVRVAHPDTGKGRGIAITRPGDGVHVTEVMSGIPAWHVGWIREVLDEVPEGAVVLAETPTTIPKMVKARRSVDLAIGMLHNNQYADPFVVGSPLRNDHVGVFRDLPELDALVVLTEQQRRDVIALGAPERLLRVVPNFVHVPEVGDTAKDPHLVTMITRIAPQKAVHEAVHAFALVLERVPEARLEIYGSGPSSASVRTVIEQLGLGASVRLMGRTADPQGVMARSVCTLSTSNWEAMPLSILESEAVGTPVVAYDCLYGPAALIEDGKTGRLVARGDRGALADAVVELLQDHGLAERLGEAARSHVVAQHTRPPVLARWSAVFDSVEKR